MDAFAAAAESGADLRTALALTAKAASKGAELTKELDSLAGRANYVSLETLKVELIMP